ncbi:penicillin-binding protein [Micromonospora sp. NBC_01699]|uniref:penicillin-binding protein n=1 Tax=Micromonospora sp. NBC_01699 TaxID=2975984 RepID=UPI002E27CA14|nr:transglycosylase domain-containing protein [Micromonospora sp. NBC_01699]
MFAHRQVRPGPFGRRGVHRADRSPGRSPRRVRLTRIGTMLVAGLAAGVLVAGLAFPGLAFTGLLTRAGVETFESLPVELRVAQAPQASRVFAADGRTPLAVFFDENRRDVAFAEIAPAMRDAIVAAEDHGFYRHGGVDLRGFLRALVANSVGGRQGASTLTMQLVRMSVTYSASDPQTVVAASEDTGGRKLREMRRASVLEAHLSKDEILARYLNLAPFGHGTYGVSAAARFYFGKRPGELTVPEAAMLAGLVKSPSFYDALDHTGRGAAETRNRRDWVIGQMVETGAIGEAEASAARAVPLAVQGRVPANGCSVTGRQDWGFFCDYFYRWWLGQDTFGGTEYDRERRLKGGGYRIVSTLDAPTQAAAHRNVERELPTGTAQALMLAAVEPGTGRVRALATNRTFALDDPAEPTNGPATDPAKAAAGIRGTYPRTTNPLLTGGTDVVGYQAGSTFKIFTVVAALEQGIPLSTTIDAPLRYESSYAVERDSPAACPGTERYCPGNYDEEMAGRHDMWSAFGSSVNTYFVPLVERVGAANAVDVARRLGIGFRAQGDAALAGDPKSADRWGAFTLGVSSTTPLELANAYATLAAGGRYCVPTPVQEIRDRTGGPLDAVRPRCKRAVRPEVAYAAIDAARCPVGDTSTANRCREGTVGDARRLVGHPLAGKTGTTDGRRTASVVETTTSLTVAGVLADPDWPDGTTEMPREVVNPAVSLTLADAMKGKPKRDFPRTTATLMGLPEQPLPGVECAPAGEAAQRLRSAGFRVAVHPDPIDSDCPGGTAAETSPGTRSVAGAVVVLRLSNGRFAPMAGLSVPPDR